MSGTKNSGRSKKPLALKIMQGSVNVTRERGVKVIGEKLVNISPPDGFGLTESGRNIWNSLSGDLVKLGILRAPDIHAFAIYCNEFGKYLDLTKLINEHGAVFIDPAGIPKIRPEANLIYKSLAVISQYQSKFGLNPVDRERLRIEENEKDNFGEEFGL